MANGDENRPNTPEESEAQASALEKVNKKLAEQKEALGELAELEAAVAEARRAGFPVSS